MSSARSIHSMYNSASHACIDGCTFVYVYVCAFVCAFAYVCVRAFADMCVCCVRACVGCDLEDPVSS